MPSVKLSSSTDNHQHHLHYQEAGTGKPVILIHGWPLTSIMWEYQIDHLGAKRFPCDHLRSQRIWTIMQTVGQV
jgi:non-heme chloroperoxidase